MLARALCFGAFLVAWCFSPAVALGQPPPKPCLPKRNTLVEVKLVQGSTLRDAAEWYRGITCERLEVPEKVLGRPLRVMIQGQVAAEDAFSVFGAVVGSTGLTLRRTMEGLSLEATSCDMTAIRAMFQRMASSKPGECELDLDVLGPPGYRAEGCPSHSIGLGSDTGAGGETSGMPLQDISEGSVFEALGFRHGDVLRAVAGKPLGAQPLRTLARLPLSETVEFQLERQGQPVTITCRVVAALARVDEGSSHPYALLSRQAGELRSEAGCLLPPDAFKKAKDGTLEVSRANVDQILEDLDCLATQARIVPSFKNGKSQGLKLFKLQPGSVYTALGLQDEDVVKAVNGHPLTSPDQVLQVHELIPKLERLSLSIERKGKPVTIKVRVR